MLQALDDFARNRRFLINVGDEKGKIVQDEVREAAPRLAIEMGAYCGCVCRRRRCGSLFFLERVYAWMLRRYSAVLIGSTLPEGGHLYSIEKEPLFAAIATKVVEFAGLRDKVTILIGTCETLLPELMRDGVRAPPLPLLPSSPSSLVQRHPLLLGVCRC